MKRIIHSVERIQVNSLHVVMAYLNEEQTHWVPFSYSDLAPAMEMEDYLRPYIGKEFPA